MSADLSDIPVSSLNLLYGIHEDEKRMIYGRLAARESRSVPRCVSPPTLRPHDPEVIFRDLARSRARRMVVYWPEMCLPPQRVLDLADTLICCSVAKGRTIWCLTHSEHLILRVMRRIRERKLPPAAVSVIMTGTSTGREAVALHIPITEDGFLGAPWPGGFFDERAGEW